MLGVAQFVLSVGCQGTPERERLAHGNARLVREHSCLSTVSSDSHFTV